MKIKLRRNSISEKSDMYEFKMDLFDNVKPEELLLFVQNFKMTIAASVMLAANAKIQYLHTLISGEALHKFDTFYIKNGSMNVTHSNQVILGLGI